MTPTEADKASILTPDPSTTASIGSEGGERTYQRLAEQIVAMIVKGSSKPATACLRSVRWPSASWSAARRCAKR